MVTIARSRAIDRLRSSGTAGRAIDGVIATPEVHPSGPPSPVEHTERRLTESKVAEALATLPAEQRQTIQLAYFDGLSQTEIAAKTGSPLGTVKMRVKLAVGKLEDPAQRRLLVSDRRRPHDLRRVQGNGASLRAGRARRAGALGLRASPGGRPPTAAAGRRWPRRSWWRRGWAGR